MILPERSLADLTGPHTGIDAVSATSYSNAPGGDIWGGGHAEHLPPAHKGKRNSQSAEDSYRSGSPSQKTVTVPGKRVLSSPQYCCNYAFPSASVSRSLPTVCRHIEQFTSTALSVKEVIKLPAENRTGASKPIPYGCSEQVKTFLLLQNKKTKKQKKQQKIN